MLFSTATGYALRTLAILPDDGTYRLAKNLAASLDLPGPYLAKILQILTQEGVLQSVRGPRGGFRLARPAAAITVGEVLGALEGTESLSGCVMGYAHCEGGTAPCPLHVPWCGVKHHLETDMTQVTILDLQRLDMGRRG